MDLITIRHFKKCGALNFLLKLHVLHKIFKINNVFCLQEKNDLIEDWQPEPLVPETAEDEPALHNMKNRVVERFCIHMNFALKNIPL